MKPVVDFKRCFASEKVCTAIKCCPVKAVSYIEVDEPILDKFLNCNCNDPNRTGKILVACTDSGCGCSDSGCGDGNTTLDVNSCGGSPYGRIIIDYEKCTRCGLCVKECCGTAIGLYPEDYKIEPMKCKPKCGCEGGCC
jgi:electron transport complex protein RnfB